jgi:hypothetical protein
MPVSVAFDTTTVTAQSVILNAEKGTLQARGNPSVIHDNEQIPARSDCMKISINADKPVTQPCE